MKAHTIIGAITASTVLALSGTASATNYGITWMSLAPTPFGSPPPFNGNYSLPGIGAVNMTYTPNSDMSEARFQSSILDNGNTSYGGNTSSWGSFESLARTNWAYSGNIITSWTVTFTFSGTVPGGKLALGVSGLGRRDPRPGENPLDCISVATCNQNGTFLGDWVNGSYGATLFTGGAGTFNMMNSVTGPNGQDPWWNTYLSATRIDDAVSSLTVHIDQTAGDGLSLNIGVLTPAPGSVALLGLGGLMAARRRRA